MTRRNHLSWFFSGVATGAVSLYLLLWWGGVLTPYLSKVRAASRAVVSELPPETPPSIDPAAPAAPGPSRKNIALPIAGLKASDILDTYYQARSSDRIHEATDIMAPRGTPVLAMVDGVVQKLFNSKPGGLTIYQFDKAGEYCYYYAHLDRYAEGIREGMEVARGTVIGYVGSTGNADPSAPHLHLGITLLGPEKHWWQGTSINPYPVLMGALR